MFLNVKKFFTFEAIFFALMAATSEAYALYYYTKIDSNIMNIGLLTTVPLLCGAITQFSLTFFKLKISNLFGIIFFQLLQVLGLFLIIYNFVSPSLWSIFLGMICYWVGGQNSLPFWMDWSSRLIPFDEYGRFLQVRNKLVGFIILVSFMISSAWLDYNDSFLYVFSIGLIARIISCIINFYLLFKTKVQITNYNENEEKNKTGSSIEESIIPKIIFPLAFFRLSVNVASPFFLPFMTRELALSPVDYAILTAAPLLSRIIVLGNWIDLNKGGKPFQVVQICALGISILPALWAINSDFVFLLAYQLISGFFWSGMEFSSTLMIQNFTYGRSRFLLSKLNASNTFFTVLGAVIGGYLFKLNYNYDQVFTFSTFIRVISALYLIYALKKIPETKLQLKLIRPILMSAISLRPSHANTVKMLFARQKD